MSLGRDKRSFINTFWTSIRWDFLDRMTQLAQEEQLLDTDAVSFHTFGSFLTLPLDNDFHSTGVELLSRAGFIQRSATVAGKKKAAGQLRLSSGSRNLLVSHAIAVMRKCDPLKSPLVGSNGSRGRVRQVLQIFQRFCSQTPGRFELQAKNRATASSPSALLKIDCASSVHDEVRAPNGLQ